MVDSDVTSVVQNLNQLLAQNENLLHEMENEVRWLLGVLKVMITFLQDTEKKWNKHEMVNQIRDGVHEAADLIDTVILDAAKQRRRNKLGKFFHSFHHVLIKNRIKRIKLEIWDQRDKLLMEAQKMGRDALLERLGRDAQLEGSLSRNWSYVEEDDVVGFDDETNRLVSQLIEGESRRDVISIIGMAGLGKTSLAKKIYNDNRIKNHFDCHAWVHVSQEYRMEELLHRIFESLMGRREEIYDEMNEDELMEKLSEYLEGKRYLVVMDDVWDAELWDEVKMSFPDNFNGSRIMITSTIRKVASYAQQNSPHFLRFLNPSESWELFSKKAFQGGSCPPELVSLGIQIVEGCAGLPLSIVVLGELFLATKNATNQKWSEIAGNVNWYLVRDGGENTRCYYIIGSRYDDLACHLKPCFLYIGAFPKDMEIPSRQLIQLWIAEGFIQQCGGRNMEDVAEEYLEELVDRSLIQVASRREDGGIKTCRIHNLLREFCISETARVNFLQVHMNVNSASSIKVKPRRLSIHCDTSMYISSHPCDSSSVRSLLCFGQDACCLSTYHWKSLYKDFKLIRVLDLGSAVIDNVPNAIEKLIHLRYLRMNAPSLRVLPHSICNLWNLLTLDMRETHVNCLPNGIWKMQQLRHLRICGPTSLPVPSGTDFKALWNLQTLSTVALDEDTMRLMPEAKFPNVTKLGLCCSSLNQKLDSLHHLHQLRTLKMMKSFIFPERPDLFPSSLTKITLMETKLRDTDLKVLEKLPNLQILKLLHGSLEDSKIDFSAGGFPQLQVLEMVELHTSQWTLGTGAMQNLTKITLMETKLQDTGMKVLENLPNLQILKLLDGSLEDSKIDCSAGGFPQLQVLEMVKLHTSQWTLGTGAMQNLRSLVINECVQLMELPDKLWSLTTLQQVEALQPSSGLARRLQKLEMKDGRNIIIYPPL